MILSTTSSLRGKESRQIFRLGIRGRDPGCEHLSRFFRVDSGYRRRPVGVYEKEMRKAKDIALGEMREQAKNLGANAIVGIDIDYETIGTNGSMLMVSASGTAVVLNSRRLKMPASFVLASFRPSTYPRGYASALHSLRLARGTAILSAPAGEIVGGLLGE